MGEAAVHPVGLAAAVCSIVCISLSNIFYQLGKKRGQPVSTYYKYLTYSRWRQMHMVAQFCFMFVVIGGTVTEMIMFAVGRYEKMHEEIIPYLDHFVALPSLGAACLSGTFMTHHRYLARKLRIPANIDRAFLSINVFGAYWVVADKVTQSMKASDSVFWARCAINLGSCAISAYIWSLMKPNSKEKL